MALWIGLIVGTFVVGLLIWAFGPERRISFNESRRREAAPAGVGTFSADTGAIGVCGGGIDAGGCGGDGGSGGSC